MNENLNLIEILKDCPKGTKLYSPLYGYVELVNVSQDKDETYPIKIKIPNLTGVFPVGSFTKDGRLYAEHSGECVLFPSKEQRDWSKFKAKKAKFDPKTLCPFDKVLVRRGSESYNVWFPDFVCQPPDDINDTTLCMCVMEDIAIVIPYNDDTKHLIGTADEAPEYYRYWEE